MTALGADGFDTARRGGAGLSVAEALELVTSLSTAPEGMRAQAADR